MTSLDAPQRATAVPLSLDALPRTPRVSVLMSNYNYGAYVAAAIDSLVAQTYTNLEIIVCDDGSTDDSARVIAAYEARDPRVTFLRQANGGQASAWNAAYARSTGDIICPLDSDDAFAPEKIARVVDYFASHAACGFLVHAMMVVDRRGREIQRVPFMTRFEDGWIAERVIRRGGRWRYMPSSALALRREVAQHIFPISDTLRVCADAFVFTLAPLLTHVGHLAEPLTYYRVHGENNISAAVYDLASAQRVNGWVVRGVDAVNARLVQLSLADQLLTPQHDLEFRQTEFTIRLLDGTSRVRLVGEYLSLLRALAADDLYSIAQKLMGAAVYGGSILLPAAARQQWLTSSLGLSRAKRLAQAGFSALRAMLPRASALPGRT
jgi:glycosyltransferase involved in cell wall biosynthesis